MGVAGTIMAMAMRIATGTVHPIGKDGRCRALLTPIRKNINRQYAKVAKGMGFQTLQKRMRDRARGELSVSVLLLNWPVLALAFMAPWRFTFSDQG